MRAAAHLGGGQAQGEHRPTLLVGLGKSSRAQKSTSKGQGSVVSIQYQEYKGGPVTRLEYKGPSLFIFEPDSWFRLRVLNLVHSSRFRRLVLGVIVLNCLAMCFPNPVCKLCLDEFSEAGQRTTAFGNETDPCLSSDASIIDYYRIASYESVVNASAWSPCTDFQVSVINLTEVAETMFTILFTLEFFLQVIAKGFIVGKHAYLRNSWNWVDFLVVVFSYVAYLPGIGNMSSLRAFRVLRPLRTLNTIPGMKVIVKSLLASVPAMGKVFLLSLLVFFVWGIVAIQLWGGLFQGKCHQQPLSAAVYPELHEAFRAFPDASLAPESLLTLAAGAFNGSLPFELDAADSRLCALTESLSYGRKCTPTWNQGVLYAKSCQPVADPMEKIGFGYVNFDHIGYAALTIFTSITLEGWVDVMYGILDTFGVWWITVPYFVSLIMVGSFFLLNLALAVIWDEYCKAEQEATSVQPTRNANSQVSTEISISSILSVGKNNAIVTPTTTRKEAWGEPKRTVLSLDSRKLSGKGSIRHQGGSFATQKLIQHSLRVTSQTLSQKASFVSQKTLDHFPMLRRLSDTCNAIVSTSRFQHIITGLILLNTLFLSMEHHGAPTLLVDIMEIANHTFTFLFLGEMVLKLLGLGTKQYFADRFNAFDFFIVWISIVEFGITISAIGPQQQTGLSALRTFRLLRVFKLARSWKNLRSLLNKILLSLQDVSTASLLLGIVMLIFSLLGMQIFAGKFGSRHFGDDPEEWPRSNFDDLFGSFVTVFQVLTGENWNEVLYNGLVVNSAFSIFYFISLNLIGNYAILNLFLAILLARFDNDDDEIDDGKWDRVVGNLQATRVDRLAVVPDHQGGFKGSLKGAQAASSWYANSEQGNQVRTIALRIVRHPKFDNIILGLIFMSSILLAIDEPYVTQCSATTCKSFALFLSAADVLLTTCFTLEMAAKMLAFGLWKSKNKVSPEATHMNEDDFGYFRNSWNQLDFLVVVVSIASLAMSNASDLAMLRSLRALRALRPLRVIGRNEGMKLVVNCIFRAIPAIMNVAMVCMLFFLIFGIVGVQNWSGALYRCNNPEISTFDGCLPGTNFSLSARGPELCQLLPVEEDIVQCLNSSTPFEFQMEQRWERLRYNFDHIGFALLTLFEVTSGEMWPDIMYDVQDAVGPFQEMEFAYNPLAALYFIIVIIVCSFLMLNVFVGVVIDNFNDLKKESDGSALLTEDQLLWVQTTKMALRANPRQKRVSPVSPHDTGQWASIRRKAFTLCKGNAFEVTIIAAILLNCLLMATRHYESSRTWDLVLEWFNVFFCVLFTIEMAVKHVGYGARSYWTNWWDRFDGFLVILAYVSLLGFIPSGVTAVFRTFRVVRVIRLVRTSPSLLTLLKTLLYSLPSLFNVGALLVLVFFIYSVAGMSIFSAVKKGEFLNEHANFDGFAISMLTLFRMATGESFNGIMHDCMVSAPYCVEEVNCGYPLLAPLYFCSFFLVSNYILLNLLVAIILDNFQDTQKLVGAKVSLAHVESFYDAWSHFDEKASGRIPTSKLQELLKFVPYPLGMLDHPKIHSSTGLQKAIHLKLLRLEIPDRGGFVFVQDTMFELINDSYEHGCLRELTLPHLVSRALERMEEGAPHLPYHVRHHAGATMIAARWRGHLQRKRMTAEASNTAGSDKALGKEEAEQQGNAIGSSDGTEQETALWEGKSSSMWGPSSYPETAGGRNADSSDVEIAQESTVKTISNVDTQEASSTGNAVWNRDTSQEASNTSKSISIAEEQNKNDKLTSLDALLQESITDMRTRREQNIAEKVQATQKSDQRMKTEDAEEYNLDRVVASIVSKKFVHNLFHGVV